MSSEIKGELSSASGIDMLRQFERGPYTWQPPEFYKLDSGKSEQSFQQQVSSGRLVVRPGGLYDPIASIADAMYELNNPHDLNNAEAKRQYVAEVHAKGDGYGTWVYFPDKQELLRYPDAADHYALRTWRNQPLIGSAQQQALYNTTIVGMGMSVGSKIMECLTESGIGNTYYLADADTTDPTNLNRTSATMNDVGAHKVDRVAAKLSAIDPWISVIPMRDGVHPEQIQELQELYDTQTGTIDCIVEEVDDITVKALAREFASKNRIPLVMSADVHDKNVTDVERHDIDNTKSAFPSFLGRLTVVEIAELTAAASNAHMPMGKERRDELMLKHTGYRNLTVGMMRAVMERNKTIGGLPQLGISSGRGGVDATFAVREILLDRTMKTGRYTDSPRFNFRTGPEASPREALDAVLSLKRYMADKRKR